jgi:hypothetical protein
MLAEEFVVICMFGDEVVSKEQVYQIAFPNSVSF